MPNIMINNYCNLRCPYCFAKDVIDKNKMSMSLDDYEYVLQWLKNSNIHDVRLIGGEPTIHPKFKEFIDIPLNDKFFQNIHIFSNCTFKDDILEDLIIASRKKNISLLPNFNLQSNVNNDTFWERMNHNVKMLAKYDIVKTVGINIYDRDQDIDYIFEIADKYNVKEIRWALAIPNMELDSKFNYKEYILSFLPLLKDFYKKSVKYQKKIHRDCNSLPICLMDDEMLKLFAYLTPNDAYAESHACNPVVDIDANLNVYRCFGLSEYSVKNLKNYDNINDIINSFNVQFDNLSHKPLFKECNDCPKYIMNDDRSCSCLKYKIRKDSKE